MFTRVKTQTEFRAVLETLVSIFKHSSHVSSFPHFVVTSLLYSIRFYVSQKTFYSLYYECIDYGYYPLHIGASDVEKVMFDNIKKIVINYEQKNYRNYYSL